MNLLEKAREYEDFAKAVKENEQARLYAERKLQIATESLVLLSLQCPDYEAAKRDGIVMKIRKAFDDNLIDISYSLPVIIDVVGSGLTMKPIKTWEELVEVLKEIDAHTSTDATQSFVSFMDKFQGK